MTSDLWWAYSFNVLVNSVLAFLTVAALVKFLIWALRIKQPRIQALCLSLPLFKVAFDLFLYNFSRWALAHDINPFQCEEGTRAITLMLSYPASTAGYIPVNTGIHFSVANGKTFTVADLITLSVDPLWIKFTVILTLTVSIGLCSIRFWQVFKARKGIKTLLQRSFPCWRAVKQPFLQAALNKSKTKVLSSSEVDVPCAVDRSIIFPQHLLEDLSNEEFEAVIVHELDHLRWRDSYLRTAQKWVCTFFWWIPSKGWLSRLEQAQEIACDASITKFNLLPVDLASAINKAARNVKISSSCLPVLYFVEHGRLLGRMKALIKLPRPRSMGFRIAQGLLMGSFLVMIFFGQFWIF